MFQRTSFSTLISLSIIAMCICFALPSAGQVMRVEQGAHATTIRVSDMPTIDSAAAATAHKQEAEPARRIPLPPGLNPANAADPVHQRTAALAPAALAPALGLGFDGLGNGSLGFTVTVAPPDTNGAVGVTQYVQWVNQSFAVFNKSTGAKVSGPTPGNALFSALGNGCATNNNGDPIAQYDKLANRWVLTQFSVSTTPFLQCVAVSTTSDATSTYNVYSFSYPNFNDYPKLAIWPDAYYITFNMFNGNTFVGADACAYDRTKMLAGQPATQICFQQGSSVGGLLPSDLDGTTAPPAGSPNYLLFFGTNSLKLFKFHVNFTTPASSTFTGPTVISVAAFSPLCGGGTCVPQSGTTNTLDSLADRLMYRLAYRNLGTKESLVVNHSVVAGSGGGVRWYEINSPNGTPIVAQQSTFAPDSKFRWMGSIAMDRAGDMGLGYSVSSSSTFPSIAFTGRAASDPASTMQAETTVITGTGAQNGTLTRWGDYSAMTVDPVDDCTFWYTQEYMKTTGTFNWNTRIANFKFPSCPSATLGAIASVFDTVNNRPEVYYAGTDLHVHQLAWLGSAGWQSFDVTANTAAPSVAAGASLTDLMDTVTNAPEAYYVAADQHIHQLYWNSVTGWHHLDISASTGAGNAVVGPRTMSTMMDTVTNTPESYYLGADQHVHVVLFNVSTGWGTADLSALTAAPPAVTMGGSLGSMVDRATNAPEAYYVGTDQHIHQLYWNSVTGWHHFDVSANTNALNVASGGALVTLMDTLTGSPEVYYVGTDQHVRVVLWNSTTGWGTADISALAGAPLASATGSLTSAYNTIAGRPEVYYVGTDGHVHQLFFSSNAWQHFDVTAFTGGANVATGGGLTSIIDPVTVALEVYYVGADQHIHQLTWSVSTGWHNFDLGL